MNSRGEWRGLFRFERSQSLSHWAKRKAVRGGRLALTLALVGAVRRRGTPWLLVKPWAAEVTWLTTGVVSALALQSGNRRERTAGLSRLWHFIFTLRFPVEVRESLYKVFRVSDDCWFNKIVLNPAVVWTLVQCVMLTLPPTQVFVTI